MARGAEVIVGPISEMSLKFRAWSKQVRSQLIP